MAKNSDKKRLSSSQTAKTKNQDNLSFYESSDLHDDWKQELVFLWPVLLMGILLYVNVIDGAFVYDDVRQITRNPLIQDSKEFWRALTSDVWAFKSGTGEVVLSNYWRPTFVLWLIINFRLFGVENPVGWHITNIFLNACVIALGYFFLRRLNLSRAVSCAIVLIFAAHPAHTESVAWISGSPDLLLALALLGSLWFVKSLSEEKTVFNRACALLLYAFALGSKEIAILFPLAVLIFLWNPFKRENSFVEAAKVAAPFVLLAVIYFILRYLILGAISHTPIGGASTGNMILSAPSVFAFYLRQIIFPYWIGPSYPLRPVVNISLTNFVIPLIVSAGALFVLVKLAQRSVTGRLGLALFLLPLLPAMNIAAFPPEHMVHDRYLYFPLFGFLMIVIPELARLIEERVNKTTEESERFVLIILIIFSIALSAQTFVYNRAWVSEMALWQRAIETDPTSSSNFVQYGQELFDRKKFDEAKAAYDRSIEITPTAIAYMNRARVLIEQKNYAAAERDLQMVLKMPAAQVSAYVLYQSYEAVAISFQQQGKLDEAYKLLIEARTRLPQYVAALTEKIAVILYAGGQKAQALSELENHRAAARTELLPESRSIFYRLGLLYTEAGKNKEARDAFEEYLSLTQNVQDEETRLARNDANENLRKLK